MVQRTMVLKYQQLHCLDMFNDKINGNVHGFEIARLILICISHCFNTDYRLYKHLHPLCNEPSPLYLLTMY